MFKDFAPVNDAIAQFDSANLEMAQYTSSLLALPESIVAAAKGIASEYAALYNQVSMVQYDDDNNIVDVTDKFGGRLSVPDSHIASVKQQIASIKSKLAAYAKVLDSFDVSLSTNIVTTHITSPFFTASDGTAGSWSIVTEGYNVFKLYRPTTSYARGLVNHVAQVVADSIGGAYTVFTPTGINMLPTPSGALAKFMVENLPIVRSDRYLYILRNITVTLSLTDGYTFERAEEYLSTKPVTGDGPWDLTRDTIPLPAYPFDGMSLTLQGITEMLLKCFIAGLLGVEPSTISVTPYDRGPSLPFSNIGQESVVVPVTLGQVLLNIVPSTEAIEQAVNNL